MNHTTSNIHIAIDAMGGDFAPACVVEGTADALREHPGRFAAVLVGREERIRDEIRKLPEDAQRLLDDGQRCSIVHAKDVIDMHDSPTAAVKSKKDSSIGVGLTLQRSNHADAFVSAGNTGAVLSASTLILGRLKHVGRPTIGALIPTAKRPCLLVDAGANVDCKPRHLFEFAVMGALYVKAMLGEANPKVGLLNIGEEDSKGNEAVQAAYKLLAGSPLNFKGNVEGRDVLKGDVDVIVCDGFVGNTLLKFGESIPSFFKTKFTALAAKSLKDKIIAGLARNSLRPILKELDYQEHGGVPILGVDGVSIIGHGRSTPKAIKNMIFRAEEMVTGMVHQQIEESLAAVQPSSDERPIPIHTRKHE
ncbi:MAG TPA: phosphate acyltransferase PlsX [Bacteroidota bacterium]|nr:phosphate acyltransferase PlsX [Bacteroidota bacterium]